MNHGRALERLVVRANQGSGGGGAAVRGGIGRFEGGEKFGVNTGETGACINKHAGGNAAHRDCEGRAGVPAEGLNSKLLRGVRRDAPYSPPKKCGCG